MKTSLSFDILNTYNCATMAIVDTSYYSDNIKVEGRIMQIISPFSLDIIETPYQKNGLTFINSNILGITTNAINELLLPIPDGLYTVKISFCPYDKYYFEKSFYRICQLECKYHKAILKLDFDKCSSCFNKSTERDLDKAKRYIDGVIANANNLNFNKATELYNYANKLLDNILNCEC